MQYSVFIIILIINSVISVFTPKLNSKMEKVHLKCTDVHLNNRKKTKYGMLDTSCTQFSQL